MNKIRTKVSIHFDLYCNHGLPLHDLVPSDPWIFGHGRLEDSYTRLHKGIFRASIKKSC